MNQNTFRAIAILFGTVIGAGILGIPYIIAQSGFLTGLIIILVLGASILLLNLLLGEVILRTNGNHQLTGYAEKYLGKLGKKLMLFSLFFGIYGALIAYIIGEGEAISALFGISPLIASLIFFVFAIIFVYFGIKAVAKYELIFASIVLALICIISLYAMGSIHFNLSNLAVFSFSKLLIPFGVILFAFLGYSAIPEMREVLVKDRKCLRKAIILGSLIPLAVYILFTFAVIGVTALNTTEIATIGLGNILGNSMIIIGNLFAIFAMLTSFLTLSLALKEVYMFDYKIKPFLSFILTVLIPLIVFLAGAKSFVNVIGITGAFSGGLAGILIVLMFWKARNKGNRKPEYVLGKKHILGFLLILLFIIGIIHQLLEFI